MRYLLLFTAFVAWTSFAAAEQRVLYGLTYDGTLKRVSDVTFETWTVRAALPSGNYMGLAYVGGWFYTYKTNGTLYRFGFSSGDEQSIGTTAYAVRGLAVRPSDSKVFASLATHSIGEVNLATGAISNVVELKKCGGVSFYSGLEAIAFYPNDDLLASSNASGVEDPDGSGSFWFRVDLSNGNTDGNMYDGGCIDTGARIPPYSLPNRYLTGLAIDPSTQQVFGCSGYVDGPNFWGIVDDEYPDSPSSSYLQQGVFGLDMRSLTFAPLSPALKILVPMLYQQQFGN